MLMASNEIGGECKAMGSNPKRVEYHGYKISNYGVD